MNLMKWGFFSGIISPSKPRKHIPTPIWIQEKGKHLIKIKDTHQEENNDYLCGRPNGIKDP